MFKDHLVAWIGKYLIIVHGPTRAAAIMADIDNRIAAAPPFLTPSSRPHRGIKGPRAERLLNRTYEASHWFGMTRYQDCDVG